MDDRTLEREIESLLATEPTPDFTARVRHRIAASPPPGLWPVRARLVWMLASAAAVVAVVTLMLRVDRQPAADRESSARELPAQAIDAGTHQAPLARRSPLSSASAVPGHLPPTQQASNRVEPEIVIDPAEAAAWRRLLAGTAAGAMTLSFARHTGDAIESTVPHGEGFALPPIIIEPLALPREQGVQP